MTVSKQQIADGLSNYLSNEIINNIPDVSTKILLGTLAFTLKNNQKAIDNLFTNPMLKSILTEVDGGYDISGILSAISSSVREYGSLEITIPSVPLISKSEKVISLTSSDVVKLKDYIERSECA